MTAQDAAGVTVAFVALERSETLAVAREAAGQPPPAAAGWEKWPDGPLHPPSVRTDPSVAGVTGAAGRPGEGRLPSREQAQPRALILAGCRATRERGDAALPPAAKPQRKVNRSPLCGTGSASPAQRPRTSAVLLFSLHGEVWRCAGSGARAGSGCGLAGTLRPVPPDRGCCRGPPASQPTPLGSRAGSPKL